MLLLEHVSLETLQQLRQTQVLFSLQSIVARVLLFSAIPFTAMKATANGPDGEWLQNRMLETKKAVLQESSKFKALAQKARNKSSWYGEERPRWLGPIPYDYPSYFTGELPGDYGFDVAGQSKDPVAFSAVDHLEFDIALGIRFSFMVLKNEDTR